MEEERIELKLCYMKTLLEKKEEKRNFYAPFCIKMENNRKNSICIRS